MIVAAILAFYLAGCAAIWVFASPQRTRLALKPLGLARVADLRVCLDRYQALARDLRAVQQELHEVELMNDALEKEMLAISKAQFSFFDRPPGVLSRIDSFVDIPRYNVHTRVLAYDFRIDHQQVELVQDLPNFLRVTKREILRQLYEALSAELETVIGVRAFKDFMKSQKTPTKRVPRRAKGA